MTAQCMEAVPQHMKALARANEVRCARAAVKREISEGGDLDALILDPPEFMWEMTLAELLGAQHRWGTTRVRKFLDSLHVGERRHLGLLTARQRELLVRRLNEYRDDPDRYWQRIREARL